MSREPPSRWVYIDALYHVGSPEGGFRYSVVNCSDITELMKNPILEANAGWVLIPFVGAVLVFSARRFIRAKA